MHNSRERRYMGINIKTPGAHHIALCSTDMNRAKHFYIKTLGFP